MDFISYLIIGLGIGIAAWVAIKQKPYWELTPEEKKKRLPLLIGGALLVVFGIIAFLINAEKPISCTMDAKQCLDGSYVGRIPPKCEFALCSGEAEWLAIKQAIANCEVESVWQTHAKTVGVKLKNGEELTAVEPELDDVIDLAIAAEPECGKILIGTE